MKGKYARKLEARIDALEGFVEMIAMGIPNIPEVHKAYTEMARELLEETKNGTSKH